MFVQMYGLSKLHMNELMGLLGKQLHPFKALVCFNAKKVGFKMPNS